MDYVEPKVARNMPGMRLALTMGVPGPWSEAAKEIFRIKGIDFVPVGQVGGNQNKDLVEWTGIRNAPIAVYNDEPPREKWTDILALAERIQPEPRLIPDDPAERALMYGLAHEICGENGFAWQRRLMMVHDAVKAGMMNDSFDVLATDYGYSEAAGDAAPKKTAAILRLLATQLHEQKTKGSDFFIGTSLTALDVYWACFCALVRPLGDDKCVQPMPDYLRRMYEGHDDTVNSAVDPILVAHRDRIYAEYLTLPLDF